MTLPPPNEVKNMFPGATAAITMVLPRSCIHLFCEITIESPWFVFTIARLSVDENIYFYVINYPYQKIFHFAIVPPPELQKLYLQQADEIIKFSYILLLCLLMSLHIKTTMC